jgi:uncharacterized protein DUF6457
MDPWLEKARDGLAAATGVDAAQLELTDEETKKLLDLARIAAHTSGERTNAPLVCYLLGRARGDHDVDGLVDVIRRSTS